MLQCKLIASPTLSKPNSRHNVVSELVSRSRHFEYLNLVAKPPRCFVKHTLSHVTGHRDGELCILMFARKISGVYPFFFMIPGGDESDNITKTSSTDYIKLTKTSTPMVFSTKACHLAKWSSIFCIYSRKPYVGSLVMESGSSRYTFVRNLSVNSQG